MRARIIALLFIASAIPTIVKFVTHRLKEHLPFEFSLNHIALDLQNDFINSEIDLKLFEYPEYHYIGHGRQAVAFASPDDKYVLKFFLSRHLIGKKRYPIPKPKHWIASHKKMRSEKIAKQRLNRLIHAMKNTAIAFEKIPEKTGIIALHFKSEKGNLPTVQLLDHTGKKHSVDLNRASFVLQCKAELVCQKLAKNQVAAMNCLYQSPEIISHLSSVKAA